MKLIELPNGSWVDPLTIIAINVRRKDNHTNKPYINVIGPDKTNNTIYCNDEECIDIARLIAKQVNDSFSKNITEQNKAYIEKTKEIKKEEQKLYLELFSPFSDDLVILITEQDNSLGVGFLLDLIGILDRVYKKNKCSYIHSIEDEQIVVHENDKWLTTIHSAAPEYAKAIYETAKKLVKEKKQ